MRRFAIGVGANLGDRAQTIAHAVSLVREAGLAVEAEAPLIETTAVGGPSGQPPYLNGAWVIAAGRGPRAVLQRLLAVERTLGRQRTRRWGPRTIDLDLLLAEDGAVLETPELVLPHPRLHLRRFVLEPLSAVAGEWHHPILRASVEELRWRLEQGTQALEVADDAT
ncbi:MAG: 2-amino-4-hydroxy-6-hydroxymethyldihydropteridine diphosphokinase [Planctomycetota bacterium]